MYGVVREKEWLTPSIVRLRLSGDGLEGFTMVAATDAYVNVAIPPDGAPYAAPFDVQEVREAHPKPLWPARRRYTVRRWDDETRELLIDVVVHGDEGVAGPWAAGAAPGDVLVFEGPGGGYRPDRAADWHLLVGDESALPAIAASLEAVPEGAHTVARLVCDGPEHEIALDCPGDLDLEWLHRSGRAADATLLLDAVRRLDWPQGSVLAFVHGEATEIREIRRHLLADRGLDRSSMSCSPYWRREMTDEQWRAVKAAFVAEMESDVSSPDG